ncbi:DUF4402 domain-containing protein [Chitinophaga silvatica]|uniref:DUF4402 domain-containing protein n=1 Tax=Chitinophaga silvatica TaxID=2282649 RepID=A0A3E1Y439_9BACT|nr:DUF4402 domain-containing protein [Chitinophaga silvatica]RFS19490.1 DUF4402 domain-containing protein [Chitinophaga silvatica]
MIFIVRYKCFLRLCITVIITMLLSQLVYAQQQPPRPITVYANPSQGLGFGAFFLGASGGTVILYPNGSRTATGSVVLANMGYPFSPAMFEVTANVGTVVSILNGPDVLLTGSNGGSISLHIGNASTGSSFITTATAPATNNVLIGGTLTVGNALANPPGNYSGIFSVTFIQE